MARRKGELGARNPAFYYVDKKGRIRTHKKSKVITAEDIRMQQRSELQHAAGRSSKLSFDADECIRDPNKFLGVKRAGLIGQMTILRDRVNRAVAQRTFLPDLPTDHPERELDPRHIAGLEEIAAKLTEKIRQVRATKR